MLSSKCAAGDSIKLRFVKELEANGFLSNLRAEAPLSNLPVLGNSH